MKLSIAGSLLVVFVASVSADQNPAKMANMAQRLEQRIRFKQNNSVDATNFESSMEGKTKFPKQNVVQKQKTKSIGVQLTEASKEFTPAGIMKGDVVRYGRAIGQHVDSFAKLANGDEDAKKAWGNLLRG